MDEPSAPSPTGPRSALARFMESQLAKAALAESAGPPLDAMGRELADWTVRVVATTIDFLVIVAFQALLRSLAPRGVVQFLLDIAFALAYLTLLGAGGKTLGGLLTKTAVVRASTGQPLGLNRAGLRSLALVGLAFTLIGAAVDVLLPLADPKRQCLHDKVAGSVVIRTGRIFPAATWTPPTSGHNNAP
ncbi:MAG: RDD family protein [Actinomycetota bacterium]